MTDRFVNILNRRFFLGKFICMIKKMKVTLCLLKFTSTTRFFIYNIPNCGANINFKNPDPVNIKVRLFHESYFT